MNDYEMTAEEIANQELSDMMQLVDETVNKGLRKIAKDHGMTIKDLAEALGYSYSHTLSILNGSKTLKFEFLVNLANELGMDVADLSIKYFLFRIDLGNHSVPAILTFNDERTTDFFDKYKEVYGNDREAGRKATDEEIQKKASELLWDVYFEYFTEKASAEYEEQEYQESMKIYRKPMQDIINNLKEEPDEFLEEINEYIEFRKTKKEQK